MLVDGVVCRSGEMPRAAHRPASRAYGRSACACGPFWKRRVRCERLVRSFGHSRGMDVAIRMSFLGGELQRVLHAPARTRDTSFAMKRSPCSRRRDAGPGVAFPHGVHERSEIGVLLVFAFSRAATRGDSRSRAVGMFFVVFLVKNAPDALRLAIASHTDRLRAFGPLRHVRGFPYALGLFPCRFVRFTCVSTVLRVRSHAPLTPW